MNTPNPKKSTKKTVASKKDAGVRKWRNLLFEIIFEADTPAGKCFDVILIVNILLSVLVVMLDSIEAVNAQYGPILSALEWFFTILFTLEYLLRLLCVGMPWRYARSFFGVVDLLAVLPSYLGLVLPGGGHFLATIRILRVLRVFRVFKLALYIAEANTLIRALRASRRKNIYLHVLRPDAGDRPGFADVYH